MKTLNRCNENRCNRNRYNENRCNRDKCNRNRCNKNKWIAAVLVFMMVFSMTNVFVKADDNPETSLSAKPLSVALSLDNENRYEGMDKSYSQGYVPRVENGVAYIVVPILCSGDLENNSLTVSLNLGDTQSMPFVCKNYEKTLHLQKSKVNDNASVVQGYVAAFGLELQKDRNNGSYPVVLSVAGVDKEGTQVMQEFTVYVNITDGKTLKDEDNEGGSTPKFAPKVLVKSYKFSKDKIEAGDKVKVDITLVNKSKEEAVKNMTVVLKEQGEFFTLLNKSDSRYVDEIAAGDSVRVSYRYKVNASTPQGAYNFEAAIDYNDTKGEAYNAQGTVKCNVIQPARVQFDAPNIPEQAEVADILDTQIQAMNLGRGKIYNVRAVVEADGLSPEGTIFIGDIEAGQTASGNTRIYVTSLKESDSMYGETKGTITYYYQDESGKEYKEIKEIHTFVTTAFNGAKTEETDKTSQWWMIMAVLAGIIVVLITVIVLRGRMHRRLADEMA